MKRILHVSFVLTIIGMLCASCCDKKSDVQPELRDSTYTTEQMLRLNCFIKVSAENREAVLESAKRLTEASLKQDGCVAYDIFESATRPDVMMICETWRDQAALDAHSASDVFVKEVGTMRSLAEMSLETFPF